MSRILFFLLFFLFSCAANKPYSEKDPGGYRFYTAKNGLGKFLVPEGWHVLEANNADSKIIYISKEDLSEELRYRTGISIKQSAHWSAHDPRKASVYAAEAANSIGSFPFFLGKELVPNKLGPMYSATFKNKLKEGVTKTKLFFLGVDALDMVYTISFTAPAQKFENEWILGASILENAHFGEQP